jgi:glutathione S-transferase
VPSFFALIKAVSFERQAECIERLQGDIMALVQAADERGPYFLGADLCLVDIHFAPFVLRLSRIPKDFRNWSDPEPGTRWHQWATAIEQNPHIQATTSLKDLYTESYDIFLNNRPSQGGEN